MNSIPRNKKVLVFCSDVVPVNGIATSGGGMRSWQIIQGLLSQGLNVIYSIPQDRYLYRSQLDRIPKGILNLSWNTENQDSIVERFHPDFIVFVNPDVNYLRKNYDIPLMADLHGPRLIEHKLLFQDNSPELTARIIKNTLASYRKIDFFTCAGNFQQFYFAAFFLLGGFELEDIQLHYMPVSLSPELPESRKDLANPAFIYAGGFYPWQNAMPALGEVADVINEKKKGSLEIFGTHHNIVEHGFKDRIEAELANLGKTGRVTFHGSTPRDDLLKYYEKGVAAIDLMQKNLERQICFSTRTIEYMWAGLPVIYNNYSELSLHIKEYRAGWCIDPCDREQLREVCAKILEHPEITLEYGKNAQKLVRDKFTWDKTIKPMIDFIENPEINSAKAITINVPLNYFNPPAPQPAQQQNPIAPEVPTSENKTPLDYFNAPTKKTPFAYVLYGAFEKILPNRLIKFYSLFQGMIVSRYNLVDKAWYLQNNQDVLMSGINPAHHYATFGWKEGRNPRPDFSTAAYLMAYPMLKDRNFCPVLHQKVRNKIKKMMGRGK